jgi:ubiquinone/menaquinone biosynthesis C-methylase UbiE
MNGIITTPISPQEHPKGTGGFLDPERIVEEFGIIEGMEIADFGSGAGYFTILIAEKAGPEGQVYALDILESALGGLETKARAESIKNIKTVWSNLEVTGSSGLSQDSLDMVLLANVLFQSIKKSEIIREAIRVLKQGGSLILIDWAKGTGGFGPPESSRTDEDAMKLLVEKEGLSFIQPLSAGSFHYGLKFKK